ncbi:MAG: glycosyltransferase family 9 protein, partial [candidate division Zixibacteria bacterium]|nr:glycosyltransferase family 9 protein [candidate division Zixibacteria bacterium]
MRILAIRFSSLGDVVLAGAALQTLARAHPDAEITLATKSQYAPLFEQFEPPVIVAPFAPGRSLRDYAAPWRGTTFDRIIDWHGSWRSWWLCRLVSARNLTRVRKHTLRRQMMVFSRRGLDRPLSVLGAFLEAVQLHDDPQMIRPPWFTLSVDELTLVERARSVFTRSLGIGWGARHPTKAVPPELWQKIITRLSTGIDAVRVFGLESDRASISSFLSEQNAAFPDLVLAAECGLTLRETMVQIAACDAFASSDSGLMHLASALGVPTAGVFGPTHPALGFAP